MSLVERLLVDLPFSSKELHRLIASAPYRYKFYTIPKRSGRGVRAIAQPAAEIKTIQRWVVENVLDRYPIHAAAKAYRQGIGIKASARTHASSRFLLKLDFNDFFPSITAEDFERHTRIHAPWHADDVRILRRLLFHRDEQGRMVLAIGAPSSPVVANSIVFDLDSQISDFAARHGINYTRYADDLAFSTNTPFLLQECVSLVRERCRSLMYPRLFLNPDKIVYASRRKNRTVTGLVLTNEDGVSVGWRRKRQLRVLLHKFRVGTLGQEELSWLRGYLAFVADVEPELRSRLLAKVPENLRSHLLVP